jgi:hypothetical protein
LRLGGERAQRRTGEKNDQRHAPRDSQRHTTFPCSAGTG